jgi:hypothetical protein
MIKICSICQKEFEAKRGNQKYCLICKTLQYKINCKYCNNEFLSHNQNTQFCSKKCIITYYNKNVSLVDMWHKKYGEEKTQILVKQLSNKRSFNVKGDKNPMYGDHAHTKGLKKENECRKGKTNIEIYGEEKAKEIHDKKSLAATGENNSAFGKVYTNGGKSLKGYYKTVFFRSLLEYSFIKHLESNNIDIHNDVDYECFKVPYVNEKGTKRNYCIDFYVKSQNIVYEVKPSYVLKKIPLNQQLKWDSAKIFFDEKNIEFKIVTEKDFNKITFNEALLDKDIEWNKKTFEYFKTNDETQKLINELE